MGPLTYRADVDPSDSATVLLHTGGKLPDDAVLHYGFGKDPYCNLGDEADMAALVSVRSRFSADRAGKSGMLP